MQRDGANKSLWQQGVQEYVSNPLVVPQNVVDVLIVGGGVTGFATALQLQKAGKTCVLAEAFTPGFGTTGGTTAHLNTFLDTSYDMIESDFGEAAAKTVFQAATEALATIQQNVATYHIDCHLAEKDGYIYAKDEQQAAQLQQILEACKRAGLTIDYTTDIPAPLPFYKAAKFAGQAQFHPTRYIHGLAQAFEQAGGSILLNCRVNSYKSEEVIVAQTSLGQMKARNIVFATHIPPGLNLLHMRNAPYRSYVIACKLKNENYPTGLVYDMEEPYHYYRTHQIDGQPFLVVGGEDHKTGHQPDTNACFASLEKYVRQYFDVDEVSFKWSSEYFEPADGLPYIGQLPGAGDNVYVATGFSGNGFTWGHVAAQVITDVITTGQSPYAKLLDPGRIKPIAGFTNFVKENADVVKEFVAKRLNKEQINSLAEVGVGEGKVVQFEGESIALYRDEKGGLHAIDPVCTHAKCIVQWNTSEKSWDCPCHGARFNADGKVLTGPASRDLDKVNLDEM